MTESGRDEFGFDGPGSAGDPPRRNPDAEFPTGPAIGEPVPNFILPNQHGEMIDFHAALGSRKAVVVFHRSAVW
mgnify:CR=1 FL=1|jgi:hypothetical protein